jgi:hypothetical protein
MAAVQRRVNDGGGDGARLARSIHNGGKTAVIAAVFDGALEVLAGKVAGSIKALRSIDDRGSNRVGLSRDNRGNSSSIVWNAVVVSRVVATLGVVMAAVQRRVNDGGGDGSYNIASKVASVFDGTLEVLAGKVAGSINGAR